MIQWKFFKRKILCITKAQIVFYKLFVNWKRKFCIQQCLKRPLFSSFTAASIYNSYLPFQVLVLQVLSIHAYQSFLIIVSHVQGVLSATPLVFIIPTACYLRLSEERWNHSDNLISCLILAVGVLVMTAGFVLTILHPQECSHGKEMFYCFASNVSSHNSTLPPQVML